MNILHDIKLASATICAFIVIVTLAVSNYVLAKDVVDFTLNLVIVLFGIVLGWVLGTFASPYTNRESSKFGTFAKAVGAFFSGYILGKMDGLIARLLDPDFLFKFENGFVVAMTLTALMTAFIVTFVFRNYAPNTRIPGNYVDTYPDPD